jgi:sugar phosphate isomerase/epimerase
MKKSAERRQFIKGLLAAFPVIATLGGISSFSRSGGIQNKLSHKLKLSLNLYSFNSLLREGKVDLFDLLDFCAQHNFDAIDPTGYYFPGYPEVPSDDFVNRFKKKAFLLGLDISGTGVRNDFADPNSDKRQADIELVKKWMGAAGKLGSPNLRIFPGHHDHEGYSREEVLQWMVKDIKTCCEHGKRYGVMAVLQNHNGFLKTADQVNELFEAVDSEWLGLNLDIGSYRENDPYEEIRKNIGRAVTWQIKENVWVDGKEVPTDFVKLFKIIEDAGYRGYLPLETLGEGNPFQKVEALLKEVRAALISTQ